MQVATLLCDTCASTPSTPTPPRARTATVRPFRPLYYLRCRVWAPIFVATPFAVTGSSSPRGPTRLSPSTMPSDLGPNVAAVLHGPGDLRVGSHPTPDPGPHQVLIAVSAVGICGSDVHYLTHGRIGPFVLRAPMVLGHEAAGVVVRLGAGVTHLAVGDQVAIEPGVPCSSAGSLSSSHCGVAACAAGRYNLCGDMRFCATPPVDGSLATYYVHAADFVYRLPAGVSMEDAALFEPLSVGIHALRRAGLDDDGAAATGPGDVYVGGAGPIGLVTLLVAKAKYPTRRVVVADVDAGRLALATELGADATVVVDVADDRGAAGVAADVTAALCRLIAAAADDAGTSEASGAAAATAAAPPRHPPGVAVAVECSGAASSVAACVAAVRPGGVVVVVGMGAPVVGVPLVDAGVKEIDLRGVFRYADTYGEAAALVGEGRLSLRRLVTHRYRLADAAKAFETVRLGRDGVIKVVIDCQGESGLEREGARSLGGVETAAA